MRRKMAIYRKLLIIYPSGFRSEYEEPMTQMVIDRIASEGSSPLFWMHLIADAFKSALQEHVKSLVDSLRAKPIPLWALLLVLGAVFGSAVAAVGAVNGGFDHASTESSVWLLVSYAIVLLAFTASVLSVGVKRSPLVGLGTFLVAAGQLSVISHEAQIINVELALPSMGAASAFPVMLGAALVAVGMSESTKWATSHMWSAAVVAAYPLILVFGGYPIVVRATGSEVAADLVFKAGYMIAWVMVGGALLLANPPNPQPRNEGQP